VDRVGKVFFNKQLAGILKQSDTGFIFTYDRSYFASGTPLSFNLPLQKEPFKSNRLFPFFSNLATEGWLKRIQTRTQKIDETDTFGLILENGKDMVGAVIIIKESNDVLQNQS
jgi:serine/threonine-protein kinase HipA